MFIAPKLHDRWDQIDPKPYRSQKLQVSKAHASTTSSKGNRSDPKRNLAASEKSNCSAVIGWSLVDALFPCFRESHHWGGTCCLIPAEILNGRWPVMWLATSKMIKDVYTFQSLGWLCICKKNKIWHAVCRFSLLDSTRIKHNPRPIWRVERKDCHCESWLYQCFCF